MREFKTMDTDSDGRLLPGPRSLFAAFGGSTLIVALIIAATIGLTSLASWASRQCVGSESFGPPGSGIAVRTDLIDIWMPSELHELCGCLPKSTVPLSDESLNRALKQQGEEKLWYAITHQLAQVDGRRALVTTIHHPSRSASELSTLRSLLEAGGRRGPTGSKSPTPRVHVIPHELLNPSARDAVVELVKNHRT
jgi:hypothetical protein